MSRIYRSGTTRSVPKSAKIIEENGKTYAKWKIRGGKLVKYEVKEGKIRVECRFWTIEYTDENGENRVISTGFSSRSDALSLLTKYEIEVKQRRLGIVSPVKEVSTHHLDTPILELVDGYLLSLRDKRCSVAHIDSRRSYLTRMLRSLRWKGLRDLDRATLTKFLSDVITEGKSSRTRNMYLVSMKGFVNWCVEEEKLPFNPFQKVKCLREADDTRRKRRALTLKDIETIFKVTRLRPIAEAGRECKIIKSLKVKDKWVYVNLTRRRIYGCLRRAYQKLKADPSKLEMLERVGQERCMIYKTMLMTGLRLNELRSLRVCDLENGFLQGNQAAS